MLSASYRLYTVVVEMGVMSVNQLFLSVAAFCMLKKLLLFLHIPSSIRNWNDEVVFIHKLPAVPR